MENHKVIGLFVGTPKELGPKSQVTAISKESVTESLIINKESLEGDQVANLKYHGGPDRVIHHYSLEQYEYLKSVFPEKAQLFVPGSYGENLTTEKLTEADLCIGDIFTLGSAKVQLTEGRKPCSTIDLKYGFKGVLKEIVSSGRYGWFYKILEEGEVRVGEQLEFVERPYPNLNLKKIIFEMFQSKDRDMDFLKEVYVCPALSERWKERIEKWI